MAEEVKDLTAALMEHFNALKSQTMEVFGLPPYPAEPTIIHFDPLTMEERVSIDMQSETWAVDILILKAKDAEGNKLFNAHSRPKLMKGASPFVIMKIANRILSADAVDPRFIEKTIEDGKRDGSLLAHVYNLAEHLGKGVGEVMRMPVAEFMAWHLRLTKRAEHVQQQ